MKDNEREYRTGQGVPVSGEYLCQSGAKARLGENDTFPVCPVTNDESTWTHHHVKIDDQSKEQPR